MTRLKIFFSLAALLVPLALLPAGCSSSSHRMSWMSESASQTLPTIPAASIDVIEGKGIRYHVIVSQTPPRFTVTLVETESGVVVVDTGPAFLKGFGDKVRDYAEAIGKSYSVVITHNHPDHQGNIGSFKATPVYAESVVADELQANKTFAASYRGKVTKVDGSLDLYGITLKFDHVKNAEYASGHNGYISIPASRDLFPGDLVYNRLHPYIREVTPLSDPDEISNWIAGLKHMKSKFGRYKRLFVGHGGVSLTVGATIDENIEYLMTVRDLITGGSVKTNQEVVDALKAKYPDFVQGALPFALPGAFGKGDPGAMWFDK